MISYIVNIKNTKPKTTYYFTVAYIIYAIAGTVFFSFYPCASLNPDFLPPILNDIFEPFLLFDHISVCPVRRKLSLLYLLAGYYAFGLSALFVYLIDRDYYLNTKGMKKARSTATKGRIILSILISAFFIYFILYVLFISGGYLSPDGKVDRRTYAAYSDNPASLLSNFISVLAGGPALVISLAGNIDLFINYNHLNLPDDAENDNRK